jgi:hypothetical protein
MAQQRVADTHGSAPTLVVVVTNQRDWRRVIAEGWYRIPLRHAPHPVAAEYLAFYLTRPFGAAAWQIGSYAPVLRYTLMLRRELLPDEPDHPHADSHYYRIAVGPMRQLAEPILSRRLRRITFIPTTLGRLHTATDVAELWQIDDEQALLWTEFRDAAVKATRRLALEA